jgi:hypothetical protein
VENCASGKVKRELKKTANKDVNEMAWEWSVSIRARNHSVSGPTIQEYGKKVAETWGRLNSKHLTGGWRVFAKDIT